MVRNFPNISDVSNTAAGLKRRIKKLERTRSKLTQEEFDKRMMVILNEKVASPSSSKLDEMLIKEGKNPDHFKTCEQKCKELGICYVRLKRHNPEHVDQLYSEHGKRSLTKTPMTVTNLTTKEKNHFESLIKTAKFLNFKYKSLTMYLVDHNNIVEKDGVSYFVERC